MSKIRHPDTEYMWKLVAKRQGVDYKSIHDFADVKSASKFEQRHFLTLRVIYKVHMGKHLPRTLALRDENALTIAEAHLARKDWKDYLADFDKDFEPDSPSTAIRDIGLFSLVRFYQKRAKSLRLAKLDAKLTQRDFDSVEQKIVASPISKRTRAAAVPIAGSVDQGTPSRLPATWHKEDLPSSDDPEEETAFQPNDEGTGSSGPGSQNEGGEGASEEDLASIGFDFEDEVVGHELAGLSLGDNTIRTDVPPVKETPADAAFYAPAADEQIVNMALLLFLNSVTMFQPIIQTSSSEWTVKRLNLQFGTWRAITDGFLQMGSRVNSILEVKPYLRRRQQASIQRQESAQMAAWILQCPEDGLRFKDGNHEYEQRLLISQDSFEIYITVAQYDSEYKSYLSGDVKLNKSAKGPFMTMTQYGPWKTTEQEHMRWLGPLILAFTIQQCSLDEIEEKDDKTGKSKGKRVLFKGLGGGSGGASELSEGTGVFSKV